MRDDAGRRDEMSGLLDSLVALGLTLNRARVYLGMLQLRSATALQLAARSGVPRTRVYEALEWLEHAGFCTVRSGRVATYEAVSPEIALSEWARLREQERSLAAERDDRLRRDLIRQLPRPETAETASPVSFMEALTGSDRVTQVFEEMITAAQERLDIVHAQPIFQPRARWNILEADAISRGVRVRVLHTPDAAADPVRYQGLLSAGGEGRVSAGLVLKLVIRDGVDAMVAVPEGSGETPDYTVVRIMHPDLVAPLQLLFQKEWRRGTPLTPTEAREGG